MDLHNNKMVTCKQIVSVTIPVLYKRTKINKMEKIKQQIQESNTQKFT